MFLSQNLSFEKKNHLTANASKTKLMSPKRDPFPDVALTLNNQLIECVSSCKISWRYSYWQLSWHLYIDHICKKAHKIHRSFHSAPINTRRTLYLTLVRPILEYASTTWHPLNIKLTNRIESMQRFACRVILQQWKLSHDELCQKLELLTLSKHRDVATHHLLKIFQGLCSSLNPYRPHAHPSLNSCAVDPPFCCLSLSETSFYPYASSLWNYLPEAIHFPQSLQTGCPLPLHLASSFVSFPCYV